MRLDRILCEGEAIIALKRVGFRVREAPNHLGWYEVEHPQLGGTRTFTEEHLCRFAEGITGGETLFRKMAPQA